MTRDEKIQTVYNLYQWLNNISDTGTEMTLQDTERLFQPHAPMTLNNRLICTDHASHFQHALDLQKQMATWHFNLPFERIIVEGENVVAYYTADFVHHNGKKGRMYDLCIFTVRDEKIAGILENIFFEGEAFEIEAFTE